MNEMQFLAMTSGYAQYFAPMMEIWRVVFLSVCIVGALVLGIALMIQRGISSYL